MQYDDSFMLEDAPRKRSWFGRNWLWFVPLVCLVPILACGGIVMLVFGLLKSSDAYTESLRMVRAHPKVVAAVGEPMEPGFLVTGQVNLNNDAGNADLTYEITGPGDVGTVHVIASKAGGKWTFRTLDVRMKSTGTHINVLADK